MLAFQMSNVSRATLSSQNVIPVLEANTLKDWSSSRYRTHDISLKIMCKMFGQNKLFLLPHILNNLSLKKSFNSKKCLDKFHNLPSISLFRYYII